MKINDMLKHNWRCRSKYIHCCAFYSLANLMAVNKVLTVHNHVLYSMQTIL